MKKLFIAAAVVLGLTSVNQNATACDKACTMGGSYLGILPQFHKNFVGVRYNTRHYTLRSEHTYMVNGVPMAHSDITRESYNSMEAWGRFTPFNRVQAFVFVPYVKNLQEKNGTEVTYQGLGDISLLANYSVVNTGDSAAKAIKQTLLMGGGVKLPTGKNNVAGINETQPFNMQPGTGSIDVLLNAMYTIRYDKVGINSDFTYRINHEGADNYRFGNRYNGSANLFYWQNLGQVSILPSAGAYYEKAMADEYHNQHRIQGGGSAFFANCGLNVYYKNLAAGATYQKPLGHHAPRHITESNSRGMLSFSYMF